MRNLKEFKASVLKNIEAMDKPTLEAALKHERDLLLMLEGEVLKVSMGCYADENVTDAYVKALKMCQRMMLGGVERVIAIRKRLTVIE